MLHSKSIEHIRDSLNNIRRLSEKSEGDNDFISLGYLKSFADEMIIKGFKRCTLANVMNSEPVDSMNFYILKMALRYIDSSDDDKKDLFKPWKEKEIKINYEKRKH